MTRLETDDEPAFAPTLHSILDRYRISAVDRLNAVKGLTGITLALAPDDLFGEEADARLNHYFGTQLDDYRAAPEGEADAICNAVVAFVWAAAQGQVHVRGKLDGAGTLGL